MLTLSLYHYLCTLKVTSFIFGRAGSSLLCGLSLVVSSQGCCLVGLRGFLVAVASLAADHGLWGERALGHRLSRRAWA